MCVVILYMHPIGVNNNGIVDYIPTKTTNPLQTVLAMHLVCDYGYLSTWLSITLLVKKDEMKDGVCIELNSEKFS